MASLAGMTAEQAVEAVKSFSFEQFWAVLNRQSEEADKRKKESDEQFKELKRLHAETERVLKETAEQMKENDKKLAELSAKTEKKLDRLSENVGGLSHSLGGLVETLVAARLWEKFKMYGLDRGFQRVPIYDNNKRAVAEIDILLSNTDCAMAVEVKTNLNKMEYVDRHIERMELIRRYPPAEVVVNNKRVMGAMAGGVVSPAIMDYAHECGFYVLELSGESARLVDPPDGFRPKVW
jgi:ElaB/YqjD/DUF883 family membrane-anchored ribosome-binding protein